MTNRWNNAIAMPNHKSAQTPGYRGVLVCRPPDLVSVGDQLHTECLEAVAPKHHQDAGHLLQDDAGSGDPVAELQNLPADHKHHASVECFQDNAATRARSLDYSVLLRFAQSMCQAKPPSTGTPRAFARS